LKQRMVRPLQSGEQSPSEESATHGGFCSSRKGLRVKYIVNE
jgi:hypothetical protein